MWGLEGLDLDLRRKKEGTIGWGYRKDPRPICKIAFLHMSLGSLSFSRGPKSKFSAQGYPFPHEFPTPIPFLIS